MKSMSSRTKNSCLIGILVLFTLFCLFQFRAQAGDDAYGIALSLNRSVNNGWLPSQEYAQKIYERLTYAGGEAHYLVFDYPNAQGKIIRQACVVFRDADGQYWAMNNSCAKPIWLAGKNIALWLLQLNPDKPQLALVEARTEAALSGRFANLNSILRDYNSYSTTYVTSVR